MARLDAFIELLYRESATALVLQTGLAASLVKPSGNRPAMQRSLTTAQIIGACTELLPAYQRGDFSAREAIDFEYQSPLGRVRVRFEPLDEGVRATVEPVLAKAAPEVMQRTVGTVAPGYHAVRAAPPPAPPEAKPAAPVRAEVRAEKQAEGAAEALRQLLDLAVTTGASDLHLTTEYPPCLRLDGDVVSVEGWKPLSQSRLQDMLFSITPEKNRAQWEEVHDTDFAHETPLARFRVNLFADRCGIGSVMRRIPAKVMSAEDMGLAKPLLDLCHLNKGLVLVTGPTGSGKSTTLAALIDYINRNRDDHILTIEDPIEFVHPHKRCLVHQREVGVHTSGFKTALRAALREDPDVVLVGELRDLETTAIAIETAETGHLVFGTLHTNTAPSTVDRVINQFPADRQDQIRQMLSDSLKAVIAQVLLKKVGGGRIPAQEVLIGTSAVSNLIREGKTFQLPSVMQTGKSAGMMTMNDALLDLVRKKLVLPRDAMAKAVNKLDFKKQLEAQLNVVEGTAEEGTFGL